MNYDRCPTCGEYAWLPHTCPPIYLVWCEYDGEIEEDARTIRADGPREAAEKWAAEDDQASAEYRIAGGRNLDVRVKDTSGNVSQWAVSGQSVPEYSARPKVKP